MTGQNVGEDELMRKWGKRKRERKDIIREIEGGGKRPRVLQGMSHGASNSTPTKVAKAQREQWKRSSKPLLDEGQGKQE